MSLIRLQSQADSLGCLERSVSHFSRDSSNPASKNKSRNKSTARSKTIDQIQYSPEPRSPSSSVGLTSQERRFQQHMEKLRVMFESKNSDKRRNTTLPKSSHAYRFSLESVTTSARPMMEKAKSSAPQAQEPVNKKPIPIIKIQNEAEHDCSTSFDNLMPHNCAKSDIEYLGIKSKHKGRLKLNQDKKIQHYRGGSTGRQSLTESGIVLQRRKTFEFEKEDQSSEATRLREMKQYQHKKCIILPDDPWKMKWNIFLINVIVMSSIYTPLQMCFFDTQEIYWEMIEFFIDIVFFADIIFSFFSAYYNKIEALVSSRRQIACGYLRTWFVIDIVAIFPLHLVTNTTLNSVGKLARLPRIYHIIKASKFIRMMKFVKHKATAKKELTKLTESGIQVERLVAFFLLFLILCHNLACLWFLVAKLDNFGERTWVYRYGYDEVPIQEQYLAALYFIVTTITTVGYGDVTSKSPAEQGFCIVLMLIGVISYSLAIGIFTSIMSASDKKEERLRQKLRLLSHVRDEYNLNFELYWRLRQALHYDHTMDMSDKHTLLWELPSKLRIELSNIMYSHQLEGIKYFEGKQPRFIATVAPLLKPVKVSKGEYIFMKGDAIDGIYFIKKGRAAYVEKRTKGDQIFASVQPGAFFGDIDFTQSEANCHRLISIKAQSDMDLLLLERDDLFKLDSDFKDQFFSLFQYSHQNLYQLREMQTTCDQDSDDLSPISENMSHLQGSLDSFCIPNAPGEQTPVDRLDTIDSHRISRKSHLENSGTPSNFSHRIVTIPKPTTIKDFLEEKLKEENESQQLDEAKKNNISNRSLVIALEDRGSMYSESPSNSRIILTQKWEKESSHSKQRHLSLKEKEEKKLATLFYKRGTTAVGDGR